jgi:hypothetical protein
MIGPVSEFVPFGAPESPVPRLDVRLLAQLLGTSTRRAGSDDALVDLLQRSFSAAMLDALSQRRQALARDALAGAPPRTTPGPAPAGTTPASPAAAPSAPAPPALPARTRARGAAVPEEERTAIEAAAARAAIDPAFLAALRRAENGGPGREFGVLSVPAPTYADQARVAATSVRRSLERFEATGGRAVDPVSGTYTPEFIEFFSRRYAPVGAANDPHHLNRYHARNLIRLYAQVAPKA